MVEFRMNPIGEIRKMRETMYADSYTWIEEVIQNAMRARAKNLKFTLTSQKSIVVEDDGVGCKDPQLIFEKSTTGWDEETLKETNPFGEGFFSLVMLGDVITIKSCDWKVVFKPGRILEEKNMEGNLTVEYNQPYTVGFFIEITELQDNYKRVHDTIHRIEKVAPFIQTLNIVVNGKCIPKRYFTDHDNSFFSKAVDTEVITGWLRPFKWGTNYDGYSEQVDIYYENRLVTEYRGFHGIKGVIHINKPVVDLRSPDRREIIRNDKYFHFRDSILQEEIKKMMLNIVINGGDDDLRKYDEVIASYLAEEDYKGYLRFIIQDGDYKALHELLKSVTENDYRSLDDLLNSENSPLDCVELDHSTSYNEVNGRSNDDFRESQAEAVKTKVGLEYGRLKGYATYYWVHLEELPALYDKARLADYYSLPVVICKNNLEKRVIEKDERSQHLQHLNEQVKVVANMENIGYQDSAEIRALWLFGIVSKAVGLETNVFRICDLNAFLEKSIMDKKDFEEVTAPAVAYNNKVYFDRRYIRKTLLKGKTERLTLSDIKFILKHIDTIAHELAHVLFLTTDNTEEHVRAQLELTNSITNILSDYKGGDTDDYAY